MDSVLSSLRYIFAKTRAVDRYLILAQFWSSIAKVLIAYIAIYLPRSVLNALTAAEPDIETMMRVLVPLAASLLVINITAVVADTYVANRLHLVRGKVLIDINTKAMSLDFAYVESADGQVARQKAYGAARNQGSGAQTAVNNTALLVAHLLGLSLYALVTAQLNFWVAVVLCVAAVLNYYAVQWARKYEASRREEVAKVQRNLEYIQETSLDYQAGKDIRLFTMGPWLEQHFQKYIGEYLALLASVFRRHLTVDVVSTALDILRDGVAYAYLITMVLSREIGIGDFTLYFAAIAGMSQWITQVIADFSGLQRGCREISYVQQYLDIESTAKSNAVVLATPAVAPKIVFENVSFRYPDSDVWTLRHFDLTIEAGEKLALVGVNGAGKTTCIKLLTGLYQPTEGRILVDGYDISAVSKEECYALFSVVFQDTMALAMSVRENIALEPAERIDDARVNDCIDHAGLRGVVTAMERGMETQLTRFFDEHGVDLSGGQLQRLMLSRALYKDAPVILLDEPTAALDPIAEAETYTSYSQLVGFKTSIYISHRLASTRFCDRIAFMENGRLQELGSHTELIAAKGKYAEMFAVQSQYYVENYTGGEDRGE